MMVPSVIAQSADDVGVDTERLEALFDFVRAEVASERLPSAQVAVGRQGRLAGMRTFGSAVQGGMQKPASNQTLYCIYSSTKAIVGVAVWGLIEDGLLDIHERVADVVPEFAGAGKDAITVEQVMLHIGGFPYAPMHPRLWEERSARLERIKGWRLNWQPGTRFEYHPTSAHWVLAEIISAKTGEDFRDYVHSRLFDRMGLTDLYVGLPDEQHGRAADVVYVKEPVAPEGGWQEVNPDTVLHFNLPSQRRAGCPGGGAFATAGDLAMFYQVLVNRGQALDGTQVLTPETIAFGTEVRTDPERHRDQPGDIPVNRGLTVVVAGDDGNAHLRGFGSGTSGQAFGHGGAGGQIAWGDPQSGLSVGFVTNGFTADEAIQARSRRISTLAAACVRP
ncbi:putative D-alanyl-D-alanine carboxypeptidase [Candidatus Entotheonellaceae bacterium PAL068K]